jgi:SAM-dependent methyltransferase
MSREDREAWDRKHEASMPAPVLQPPPPPPLFSHVEHHFPKAGSALDIACGRGEGAVWLAGRGLSYHGVDVSPVAIGMAQKLVDAYELTERCRLEVWDLDDGLPPGPLVDVMFCHMFRDPTLYGAMIERLAPGGLLAVAVLSEVGGAAGPFRAPPGELREAFGHLEVLDEGEGDGMARILARSPNR